MKKANELRACPRAAECARTDRAIRYALADGGAVTLAATNHP